MYFISFYLILFTLNFSAPDETIKAGRLTIVDTELVHDARFNAMDLVALMDHPHAASLELRMVTCPEPHMHPAAVDELPDEEGFQHIAVYAAASDGRLFDDEAKAALPCPPHCGGGKKLLVTLAEFREHYE